MLFMALSKEEKLKRLEERRLKKYKEFHKTIDGVVYKQCNHHKEYFPDKDDWLPLEECFYPNKSNSIDGFNTYCKECTKSKATKWVENNRDSFKQILRKNNRRKETKEIKRKYNTEFKNKGLTKKWKQENKELVRSYSSNHRQHDITKKEWVACQQAFNCECAYCGITLDEHKKLYNQQFHKEHVNHEGYNDIRNCIPSCKMCNSSKHQDNINEWYPQQNFYSKERLDKINWWITEGYKKVIEEKPLYKIVRKRNGDNKTYHFELWTVDEKRNLIECVGTANKKEKLDFTLIA